MQLDNTSQVATAMEQMTAQIREVSDNANAASTELIASSEEMSTVVNRFKLD